MARPRPHLYVSPHRPPAVGALPTVDGEARPLLRVQSLGAASILIGDLRIGASAGTLFSLLLRVCGAPACQVSRRVLRDTLWPDQEELRQSANLRQALYKLRGYGVRIGMAGDTVVLDAAQVLPTFCISRTVELFARDVTMGHEPFGVYLAGFTAPGAAMREWIEEQRELVQAEVRRVLCEQLKLRRSRADWGGADALARWLLLFDPLNEEATLTMAECTALAGSKSEALAILDRYLAELGLMAGDIRLPAAMLRRRIAEPASRGRVSFAPTERHFVGRQEELAALTLSMRRARWHDGSAILVYGPSGMGKSRVVYELTKVASIEGIRVVQTACRESDMLRPLSVFLDVVPELLTSSGSIGCAPESLAALRRFVPGERAMPVPPEGAAGARSAVERRVSGEEYAERAVGISPEPEEAPIREPVPMASSLRRAIIDLLSAVSEEKPILLVVDDAHWIDEHSWDVLSDLIDRCHTLRVFVVLTSREPHARMQRPQRTPAQLQLLSLPPLSAESCLELSRAIGDDLSAPIDDDLGAWFIRASEGVPLFLRALVNHWIETGEAGGVPPTLQGVIEQRLSQLSGDALRVLQTAALLGKWATVERVGAVLELEAHRLLASICELETRSLVNSQLSSLVTVHELVVSAAVSKLRVLSLAAFHSRIAKLLETEIERSPSGEILERTILHFLRANDEEAAVAVASRHIALLGLVQEPNEVLRQLSSINSQSLSTRGTQRIEAACSRLRTECSRYQDELASHSILFSLPQADASLSNEGAERAVAWVDSAYRSDSCADLSLLSAFASRIAVLRHLSNDLRLRAAGIAFVIMSNQCDEKAMDSLWEALALEPLSNETSLDVVRVAIVYHAQVGSRSRAVAAAKLLLVNALRDVPSASSVADALRAGFALRITSNGDQHLEAFRTAYAMATELSLRLPAMTAAWQLSQCALEDSRSDEASAWSDILKALHEDETDRLSTSFATAYYCRQAIERNDALQAQAFYDQFAGDLATTPSLKAASHQLALRVAIDLLDPSWQPQQDTLDRLLFFANMVGRFGTSDFLVSIAASAWMREDKGVAEVLLQRYIGGFRRESTPISKHLQKTLVHSTTLTERASP